MVVGLSGRSRAVLLVRAAEASSLGPELCSTEDDSPSGLSALTPSLGEIDGMFGKITPHRRADRSLVCRNPGPFMRTPSTTFTAPEWLVWFECQGVLLKRGGGKICFGRCASIDTLPLFQHHPSCADWCFPVFRAITVAQADVGIAGAAMDNSLVTLG